MEYAPVHPSDFKLMDGVYGKCDLPMVPGMEGVGVVTSVGADVLNDLIGKRVATEFFGVGGAWSEMATLSKNNFTVIPDAVGPKQAAFVHANPVCAYYMTLKCQEGQHKVIMQDGAYSQIGRMIIRWCKTHSITTINIVRKSE